MSDLPIPRASQSAGNRPVGSQPPAATQAYYRPPSQNDRVYSVSDADDRPAHPPGMALLPQSTQYSPLIPIAHQALAFPGSGDMTFTVQQPVSTLAPSVLHIPRTQAMAIPGGSGYVPVMDPSLPHTSTSAPTISVGDWIPQLTSSSSPSVQKPTDKPIKKPRQQFSACTACRIRRVKCDLKDLRVEWEKLHLGSSTKSSSAIGTDLAATFVADRGKRKGRSHGKPDLTTIAKKDDIRCTNCYSRGSKCIDEFAHRKRARPEGRTAASVRSQAGRHSVSPSKSQSINLGSREKYLELPEGSSTWRSSSQHGDFYSPLEEKPIIDFGELSWTEASRDTWDATEDEEPKNAEASISTHPELQESLSVSSLSFEPQGVSKPITVEDTNNVANLGLSGDGLAGQRADATSPEFVIKPKPSLPQEGLQEDHDDLDDMLKLTIPELDIAFFESDFYRSLHIQRPIMDPVVFKERYLSVSPPRATNMGQIGAILCQTMYAWACSYGVNGSGELAVAPREWHSPSSKSSSEQKQPDSRHEIARRSQLAKTNLVIKQILKEIDRAGIYRKITWDGVRCLLLVLPLTEYTCTSAERSAMYECALGQVFQLCSASALGYDGLPHVAEPTDEISKRRLYWYAFVHEGITTGLKGGRMVLEEDDIDSLEDILPKTAKRATASPDSYNSVAKFASAPIRLSIACRLIHKALTGPKARRSEQVDSIKLRTAWTMLEEGWREFETIKTYSPGPHRRDDLIRFADGWKFFLYQAHNVVRESLEHRTQILLANNHADPPSLQSHMNSQLSNDRRQILLEVQNLRNIAQAKCQDLTVEIVALVRHHLHSPLFEWDANLVRDGIYYAATLLAAGGGAEDDISCCVQALSQMRWGFSRSLERIGRIWELRARTAQPSGGTNLGAVDVAARAAREELTPTETSNLQYYLPQLSPSAPSMNMSSYDVSNPFAQQEPLRSALDQHYWSGLPEPSEQGLHSGMGSLPVGPQKFSHLRPQNLHAMRQVGEDASSRHAYTVPGHARGDASMWAAQPVQYGEGNHIMQHWQGQINPGMSRWTQPPQ